MRYGKKINAKVIERIIKKVKMKKELIDIQAVRHIFDS